MKRVVSVHEYELKPGIRGDDFERAVSEARGRGLLDLPGLIGVYLLKGIRGTREHRYAAVWIYESPRAWRALWGEPGHPVSRSDYPEKWKIWEETVLAPFLEGDPDRIRFTSYREL